MRRNGMKGFKKYAAIGLSLVFAIAIPLSFSACEKVEDYMPEAYGEWEGNYIYKGNGRSTTTGEEYEKLVESVVVDGTTMYAADCIDYEIVGDEIYMALYLTVDESAQYAYHANCLVKYDVKEKTQTLIRYFSQGNSGGAESMSVETAAAKTPVKIIEIVCLTETEIIVGGYDDGGGNGYGYGYYGVNFDGSLSENDYSDLYGKRLYGDEYFVEDTKTGISYRTWENAEYKSVFSVPHTDGYFSYEYLEKGGKAGLLIYAYHRQDKAETDGGFSVCDGVWFYDFLSDERYELADGTADGSDSYSVKALEGGEYFVAFQNTEVIWYEQKGCLSKVENKENAQTDCVLYEISYGETVTAAPVCTFDKTMDFAGSSCVTADKIYFQTGRYESAKWLFKDGGHKYYYYAFDRETANVEKTDEDDFFAADEISEEECAKSFAVDCGEYTYYLKINTLQLGIWAGTEQVLTLMRVNPDGTEEALQFGESGSMQLEGAKYCEEMWSPRYYEEYPSDIRAFIVRSY